MSKRQVWTLIIHMADGTTLQRRFSFGPKADAMAEVRKAAGTYIRDGFCEGGESGFTFYSPCNIAKITASKGYGNANPSP